MDKKGTKQLAMPLTPPEGTLFSLDRFYAGDENRLALEAARRFGPGSPPAAFVITGRPKSGKSHLLKGIRGAWGKGPLFSAPELAAGTEREIRATLKRAASHPLVCIDDLDLPGNPKNLHDEVFHLFNSLAARGGHLAVTLCRSPAKAHNLPDYLASRLLTGMVISLKRPDEGQRRAVLMKIAGDHNIRLTPRAAGYVLTRGDRSVGALIDFVRRLEEGLGPEDRKIGLQQIRRVLI